MAAMMPQTRRIDLVDQIVLRLEWKYRLSVLAVSVGFLMPLLGCASVGPHEQRLVSKPNMLFADSAVFAYQSKLLVQTEPGSGFVAGGKAAGCTSCR